MSAGAPGYRFGAGLFDLPPAAGFFPEPDFTGFDAFFAGFAFKVFFPALFDFGLDLDAGAAFGFAGAFAFGFATAFGFGFATALGFGLAAGDGFGWALAAGRA